MPAALVALQEVQTQNASGSVHRHCQSGKAESKKTYLLSDGELDTTALGHRDPGLAAVTDDEDVAQTGGEVAAEGVANVNDLWNEEKNIPKRRGTHKGDSWGCQHRAIGNELLVGPCTHVEATLVLLTTDDNTSTTLVTTTGNHNVGASVELDRLEHLVVLEVELDSVVNADDGVGVTESATVVGDDEGNTLGTELHFLHLEELVGGLLGGDAVDDETALDVVEQTEVLARLLDGDDVHEASGVGRVGADLVVDLDQALGSDGSHLTASKGVLEAVAEQHL